MKLWKLIVVILLLGAGILGYFAYNIIYRPNVPNQLDQQILEVPNNSNFDELVRLLIEQSFIEDESSFRLVSKLMKYDQKKHYAGRFKILPNWNNRELISLLRSGRQAPVDVTINAVRQLSDMAGKVSRYIEVDSLTLLEYLRNPENLQKWGYTSENILSLFIPNTYEFYWDTTPKKFVARMIKEHNNYWSQKNREQSIKKHGITKSEAYTLASIIEKETTNPKERRTISGVYHNRLKRNIALQADPTVVFAVGDFSIRRVLNKHLSFKSPYNTYLNTGLPPGPIYMPTLASLEAAIFPEENDYIFFCAKPGYENEHSFASTLREHNRNAKIFHKWLNGEGIRK